MPTLLTMADLGVTRTLDSGKELCEQAQNEGPMSGTIGNDKSSGKRVFLCKWSELQVICRELIGGASVAQTGSTKYISRTIPDKFPIFFRSADQLYFMHATHLDWVGMRVLGSASTATVDTTAYNFAKLTVQYETLPYDFLRDGSVTTRYNSTPDESGWERYVTKQVKPQGEYFTVRVGTSGGNGYTYVGGGSLQVQQGIPKLIVPYNLMVTWHQIPESAVPCNIVNPTLTTKGAIDYAIGRVNDATFNGYLKGTLLLMGAEMKPYRSSFGERIYDITYMFKFFEPQDGKSSQYIFKSDTPLGPGWIEITTDGATNLTNLYINKSVYDWFPGGGTAGTSDTTSTKGTGFVDLFRVPA